MSKAYVSYDFDGYPGFGTDGEKGLFTGRAKIKLRPNPDFKDRWTVDDVLAKRDGNCAALRKTAWDIQNLDNWLKGKHIHSRQIDVLIAAAEEAEGR